jgi:acyl dehydratase
MPATARLYETYSREMPISGEAEISAGGPVDRTLRDELVGFVGKSSGPPRLATERVNGPMIRQWCTALGDRNPVYLEADAAARTSFGELVAPPTMLQSWTHHDRRFPQPEADNAEEQLGLALIAAGFYGVVATRCRVRYARYLRPGERTSYESRVESVSERKQTALGAGYFITRTNTYRDQAAGVVGTIESTTLRYRPHAAGATAPPSEAPSGTRPATDPPPAPAAPPARPDALAVGQALPLARYEITTTLIVCGAIASCDFFAGHHDVRAARAMGQPDIFMNIMTSQGLVSRYLTDWSGPSGVLRGLDTRLGIANRPGDTLVFEGTVDELTQTPGGTLAVIDLRGTIARGRHINARAELLLPDRTPAAPSAET